MKRTELESLHVDELKKLASENNIEGRSGMNKEELVAALATDDSEGDSSDSNVDPEVKENLSSQGQEAVEEYGEDSVAVEEAKLETDAAGPLRLQPPSERIMTGAVSEEHAKEQREAVKAGGTRSKKSEARPELDENGDPVNKREHPDKAQEDVIDFPPPVAEDPRSAKWQSEVLDKGRTQVFGQRAQLYTDGISGEADSNIERAYELPEIKKQ